MHGVLLAALGRAGLVKRVEFHNPAREINVVAAFNREAEILTAHPCDAAFLSGREIIVARALSLAQHIVGDAGNAFADDDARHHQRAITRDMVTFNWSIVSDNSPSRRSSPVAFATWASWFKLLPMARSSSGSRLASGLRRTPATVGA